MSKWGPQFSGETHRVDTGAVPKQSPQCAGGQRVQSRAQYGGTESMLSLFVDVSLPPPFGVYSVNTK